MYSRVQAVRSIVFGPIKKSRHILLGGVLLIAIQGTTVGTKSGGLAFAQFVSFVGGCCFCGSSSRSSSSSSSSSRWDTVTRTSKGHGTSQQHGSIMIAIVVRESIAIIVGGGGGSSGGLVACSSANGDTSTRGRKACGGQS